MRVLLLNYECPPLGGGGGVAALDLARELVRTGHEVDYVTTGFRGLPDRTEEAGVRIFRERVTGRNALQTASALSLLIYPLAAVSRGLSLSRERPYDVLNTHFAIPSGPAGAALSALLHLPNVLSVYGADIYDPTRRHSPHRNRVLGRVVRAVLDRADVIVPESFEMARRAMSIYRPRPAIEVVPLGLVPPVRVPARPRCELGLREDAIYAIAVGRLVARKGTHDLLRALARVPMPELQLIVVGDGPELPALRRAADAFGVAGRVQFRGQVDEATKYALLAAADLFALASIHEGFGIVYLEAMYCGLPIATTDSGGQTDFLTDGRNALLSPPGSPEALAESLTRLASSASLRSEIGERNRKEVEDHLIGSVARRYVELFELVRRRAGRR